MTRPRLLERTARTARTGLMLCVLITVGGGIVVGAAYLASAIREKGESIEFSLKPFGFGDLSEADAKAEAEEVARKGFDIRSTPRSILPRDQQLFRDWVNDHMKEIDDVRLLSLREVRKSEPRRVRVKFNCESILGGTMRRDWVFEQQKDGFVKLN